MIRLASLLVVIATSCAHPPPPAAPSVPEVVHSSRPDAHRVLVVAPNCGLPEHEPTAFDLPEEMGQGPPGCIARDEDTIGYLTDLSLLAAGYETVHADRPELVQLRLATYDRLTPDDRDRIAAAGIDGIAFVWVRATQRGLLGRDTTLHADVELHAAGDGALLWRTSCHVAAHGHTLALDQEEAVRCALAAIPGVRPSCAVTVSAPCDRSGRAACPPGSA
ncbi:MAG TPA: hypothetical protein VFQ53_24725 [Kofleriaceae bacterium]|nr:hypothetical protein [Kofleriaceae bacterium]